ncbi:uncharacterized protein MELLADRAFT_100947 [Melampsora larici-populina 98AG31]|uniref:Secreted protein n=1 Tax=Melampsora larici-populina (strain 98AG31 / pathotype 3-4-7) TaxID=747676 RepID=F4R336_MELLP|nr:uncharacterized protein MELLADRAFT_100947 [Melampsora larici-populina 98AG31]EGG13238.1 secreted protein [Melampsora larici-populina 98AG31]
MKSITFILLLSSTFYFNTISKNIQSNPKVESNRFNPYKNAYPDTEPINCMKFPNSPGATPYAYKTTVDACLNAAETLINSGNQGVAQCENCKQYFLDKNDRPIYPSAKTGMNLKNLEYYTRRYLYMACVPENKSLPPVVVPEIEDIPPEYAVPDISTPWTIELMDFSLDQCQAGENS